VLTKILLLHGVCRNWPGTQPADLMKAYLTFGVLTREIGIQIKALIQKGSFGVELQRICAGRFRLTPFARTGATPRRV